MPCPGCLTPRHDACADEFGCGTFGCVGKRGYVFRPQPTTPIRPLADAVTAMSGRIPTWGGLGTTVHAAPAWVGAVTASTVAPTNFNFFGTGMNRTREFTQGVEQARRDFRGNQAPEDAPGAMDAHEDAPGAMDAHDETF